MGGCGSGSSGSGWRSRSWYTHRSSRTRTWSLWCADLARLSVGRCQAFPLADDTCAANVLDCIQLFPSDIVVISSSGNGGSCSVSGSGSINSSSSSSSGSSSCSTSRS